MNFKKGFTFAELLIVIAVLGLLLAVGITSYKTQVDKGHDARRKQDLDKIRTALEDFFSDNNRYPTAEELTCGNDLSPWIKRVPCDAAGDSYIYITDTDGKNYKIYTILKSENDPAIQRVGCQTLENGGCPNNPLANYGISGGLEL